MVPALVAGLGPAIPTASAVPGDVHGRNSGGDDPSESLERKPLKANVMNSEVRHVAR
jgi:hypothetical protein